MNAKKLHILFMSGTGNSLRVAHWLYEQVQSNQWEVQLNAITAQYTLDTTATHIALIFPTHGFTMPWPILRASLAAPRGGGKNALIVATRGGTKLGKFFFPGLDGTATLIPALIFALKGYKISGLLSLDMPSNWMALHSGFNEVNANAIISRTKHKAQKYFDLFIANKRFITNPVAIITGIALIQLSFGYLVVGRIFLGKLFYASNKCTNCGVCANTCPFLAIKLLPNSRPYWTYKCESCMHCMAYCPHQAIEVNYLLMLVFIFLFSFISKFMSSLMPDFFFPFISIGIILTVYPLVFTLLKSPIFNRITTYLTPTRFYHRYHEPNTKISDVISSTINNKTK